MKVLVVYNLPTEKNSADDLDVLVQVEAVKNSLEHLGNEVSLVGVDLNLERFAKQISEINPDLVFNLVEAINGVEMYMHFIPTILEKQNIPFTGTSAEALFTTTDKIMTKRLLNFQMPVIIKPIYTDASVGLDDNSIIYNRNILKNEFMKRSEKYGKCFIEEFIEGREFNISILDTYEGVKVLPIAEIRFEDYPEGKAKIVNYDAKWKENSFEYSHTVRHFDFEECDKILLKELENVTLKCWKKFNLRGYARVDFRVDKNNNIYVLEINSNPGIAPDSGFFAASHQYGWDYNKMIETISKSV